MLNFFEISVYQFDSAIHDARTMLEKWCNSAHANIAVLVDRKPKHGAAMLSRSQVG